MSEMLGHQLFLARNFAAAAVELEKACALNPKNKPVRKKLVICLNEIGKIRKALHVFISLCSEDAGFIINTDPIDEDCPCPELIYNSERYLADNLTSIDFQLRLGMLWLYCDIHESIRYFENALEIDQQDREIKSILTILKVRRNDDKKH